jgi:hypothetical protein
VVCDPPARGCFVYLERVEICPICVAFKARGIECRDVHDGKLGGFESRDWDSRPMYSNQTLRTLCKVAGDNVELLHALAHRHNKEMHSTNGNILFQNGAFDTREVVAGKAATLMWEKNTVVESGTEEVEIVGRCSCPAECGPDCKL